MADSEVLRAEKFAARYFETKAVRFCRAEDALLSVLSALDLSCGGEIIVSANLCTDISAFVRSREVKFVFSDLCHGSFVPSQEDIVAKLTDRTKAVVVSHSFGSLCCFEELSEKLKQMNIPFIEECAGCAGSVYFSDGKILRPGASGIGCVIEPEFALICCHDEAFAEKLPLSDSVSAANFMRRQPDFERINGRRKLAGSKYRLLIHENALLPFVSFPQSGSASFASASLCPLCVRDRDGLKEYLASRSISCGTQSYAFENTGCTVFEKLKNELLLLPLGTEISEAEQEEIISHIKYFYRDKNCNLQ
ncbi:MAG: DegT/DnrJ/EryC1/StrS family aminotransferase [Synergistaceae bacterium]|nr:DegT/DnrJ/EryC1/StrS family aminotransferase [Synergistaceae bacterium]